MPACFLTKYTVGLKIQSDCNEHEHPVKRVAGKFHPSSMWASAPTASVHYPCSSKSTSSSTPYTWRWSTISGVTEKDCNNWNTHFTTGGWNVTVSLDIYHEKRYGGGITLSACNSDAGLDVMLKAHHRPYTASYSLSNVRS